jgi:hypothetical protein
MKKYILIVFILHYSKPLISQGYFNNLYDYNGSNQYSNAAKTSVELGNGDFLISGQKYPSSSFGGLVFIKINTNGDTIFKRRYPDFSNYSYTGSSNSLIKTLDNKLVQCGATYVVSSNVPDGLLIKLNEDGDTLWTKTYGGSNFDNANTVCQTTDSGFVLMGSTQSFSNGPASDFYLVKTDKYGNQQWQQTYGTTLAEDCVSGQITLDGGYVMAGRKESGSASIFYMVKTDVLGNVQWQKTYSNTVGVCFVKQLADSSYVLTGAQPFGSSYKPCIIKTTKNGTFVWQKNYGNLGSWAYTQPIILNDGSFVVAGQQIIGGHTQGFLLKTDSAGNEQWTRTYYANPNNDNYVYDVKHTSDGGFILTGSGNVTGQDAWVVKVDSLGCEVAGCSVGVEEFEVSGLEFQVYPNPASNNLTIKQFGNESIKEIKIYNVMGECVFQKNGISNNQQGMMNNEVVIDVRHLPSGIYFIEAIAKEKKLKTKFIRE